MKQHETLPIKVPERLETPAEVEFRRGLVASVPVMIGFVPFALVLGAQCAEKGFGVFEVPLMTGMNFGGGSEFAALELWTSPPQLLLIVAIVFLVNSRHILMSAMLAPHIRHLPRLKALAALFFMCDESWAMGLADVRRRMSAGFRPSFNLAYYLGVSTGLYLAWVVFTTTGVLVGPVMGDIRVYGFDMAFPAVFLVLLRGMWKSFQAAWPWFISLAVAALTYRLAAGAWYVPLSAVSGVVVAAFCSNRGE